MRWSPPRPLLLGHVAAALLAATPCFAQSDPSDLSAPYDPLEKTNRRFFAVEEVVDRHIFSPLARSFGSTPSPIRTSLSNFSRNLSEPVVAVNDLLQGRVGAAASTVGRFAINSIFGVAGLADPAKAGRIPHHPNNFGTTLGRWGVNPGPYLFLPLVGPTTVRDGFGDLVDVGLNPLSYVSFHGKTAVGVGKAVVDGLEARYDAGQELAVIRATSTDPYATLRSYFLQNRQAEITGQTDIGPLPEFEEPPPATETAPPAGGSVSRPQPMAPLPPLPGEAGALPPPPEPAPPPPRPPGGSACPPPP